MNVRMAKITGISMYLSNLKSKLNVPRIKHTYNMFVETTQNCSNLTTLLNLQKHSTVIHLKNHRVLNRYMYTCTFQKTNNKITPRKLQRWTG